MYVVFVVVTDVCGGARARDGGWEKTRERLRRRKK
jgi:hypothetical protein